MLGFFFNFPNQWNPRSVKYVRRHSIIHATRCVMQSNAISLSSFHMDVSFISCPLVMYFAKRFHSKQRSQMSLIFYTIHKSKPTQFKNKRKWMTVLTFCTHILLLLLLLSTIPFTFVALNHISHWRPFIGYYEWIAI